MLMLESEPRFELRTETLRKVQEAIKHKADIEANLKRTVPELEKEFVHRVVTFTLSGTEIVDLRHYENKNAKIACGLKSEYLTGFLCQIIYQRRKSRKTTYKELSMSIAS